MSDDQRSIYLTIDLALRVGELVLASGAGAADTTATMLAVTSAAGLRNCEVDVTFTSLTISYQGEPDVAPETHMRQVRYRALDYTHLTSIDHMVRSFAFGEIGVEEARKELATIISAGHPYPKWASMVGWGAFAGFAGILIGGGLVVFLVAFASGVLIDAINRQVERRRVPNFYQQVIGGFLATVIALGVGALLPAARSSLIVAAVIILLLAGMAIVGAVQDALTGFYVTASARSFEAILLTGGIIGGIGGGLGLVTSFGYELSVQPFAPLGLGYLPIAALSSAAASASFAFASFAPPRALFPVAVIGAASQVVFRPAIELGLGSAWASAIAALFVGMVSYSVAGRVRVPPLVVVVSGIVPLLPGLSTYRGLFQLFQGNVLGVTSLFAAVGIAVGIAAGVILGEYIAQPLRREARRLETRLAGPRLVGPMRPKRRPKRSVAEREAV
ncbi:MAG TPA: threonine/serine exporter family protein [Nocardioidaceae bacterium]|nr:threonine/serine exporter family protein [Nocardioidaceae bacterium]